MHTDLRFQNWEIATANRKSQAAQDLFVLCATHGQRGGTFLEIGASDAKELSNTYILEKFFKWQGVSLDIDFRSKLSFLRHGRKSKFILKDATRFDYRRVETNFPTTSVIDYLSLDIEPMTNTLKALKQVMAAGLTFRVITYETDFYDMHIDRQTAERVRTESRQILSDAGYSLVAGDVCVQEGGAPFEDWWVRADLIDAERLSKIMDTFGDGMSGDALLGVVYKGGEQN